MTPRSPLLARRPNRLLLARLQRRARVQVGAWLARLDQLALERGVPAGVRLARSLARFR